MHGHLEGYDFSPLEVRVVTALDPAGSHTAFRQTITYPSSRERDEDFEGAATSAAELDEQLERSVVRVRV